MIEAEDTVFRSVWRSKEGHNFIWYGILPFFSQELAVRFHSYGPNGGLTFERAEIEEIYPLLRDTIDLAERDRLLRAAGDVWFYNYKDIPLFWLSAEVVVDPDIVAEYAFPGLIPSVLSHFEHVVAVPK